MTVRMIKNIENKIEKMKKSINKELKNYRIRITE